MIACVGGGSNAIGTFVPVRRRRRASQLIGVEAAGEGIETGRHGAPLTVGGRGGVLHGAYSAIMQDEDGQILEAHSISRRPRLPRHRPRARAACATPAARATTRSPTREALAAFQRARRARGDHPGARVLARGRLGARRGAADGDADTLDLICLSGRGDKDLAEALDELGA